MKSQKINNIRLLIGPPADPADIRYLSGFSAVDPVLLLDVAGRKTLVVRDLELGRAKKEARVTRVVTVTSLVKRAGGSLFEAAVALLRAERIRRVSVSRWFPARGVEVLHSSGIRVDVQEGPIVPEREWKSPREIACLMRAQRIAAYAMRTAIDQIRAAEIGPGGDLRMGRRRLYAEDLHEVVESAALRRGGLCIETIVAGGRQAANPHERGSGPLRAGEAIVLDIFPRDRATGYWGDLTRTVVRGRPSEQLLRMYTAVQKAQQAAIACVRAGAECAAPHRAACDIFVAMGFRTRMDARRMEGFIHSTGHGLGLEIHEAPSLADRPGRLCIGHVVTVEPGLYYPDIGGVRIEDVVCVTRRGAIRFPAPPRQLLLDADKRRA